MLQTQWTKGGVKIADVEPGPVREGWVRLKVSACGICGSDLHVYKGEQAFPCTVPGHEIVGTVENGPKGLGDHLYAVEPHTRCGECDTCVAGNPHLCPNGALIGTQEPGGLAEFVDLPPYTLHPVDSSIPVLTASLVEPLACGFRAAQLARLDIDSRVLVLGAGAIGLCTGLILRDRVEDLAITVRYPQQREAAKKLGMNPLTEEEAEAWSKDREPDIVVETVGGKANTLEQAVRFCRPGGRIVLLGVFSIVPAMDPIALLDKELSIIPSNIYGMTRRGSEFRATVSLLPRYREDLKILPTHQFPLTSIQEAFDCAADKKSGAIKVTLLP